jgi:hypothetical protein
VLPFLSTVEQNCQQAEFAELSEADELGERHREMREALRVDGNALDPLDLALAQGAPRSRRRLAGD